MYTIWIINWALWTHHSTKVPFGSYLQLSTKMIFLMRFWMEFTVPLDIRAQWISNMKTCSVNMIEIRKETRQRIFLAVELFIHLFIYVFISYYSAQLVCVNDRSCLSSLKTMTKVKASTFLYQFSVYYYVCLIES